jgi:hypothetical protein
MRIKNAKWSPAALVAINTNPNQMIDATSAIPDQNEIIMHRPVVFRQC